MGETPDPADVWRRVKLSPPRPARVSVLVVSYHTGDSLKDCLAALLDDPQVGEVIVADNGNPPGVTDQLQTLALRKPALKILSGHGNVGYSRGVNLAAAQATGDRLLVLNPDAILRRGSIAAMELAAEGAREPYIIGGRIYGRDGAEQRGGRRRLPRLTSSAATFLGVGRDRGGINMNLEASPDAPVRVEAVSGAMMYMSRSGFLQLGGFDEGYFLHVEDLDICRRAGRLGGDVIYAPDAGALHVGGTSDAPKLFVEWNKAKGFARYFAKFSRTPFGRVLAWAGFPVIAGLLAGRVLLRRLRGA